jgi:hypothetical protein
MLKLFASLFAFLGDFDDIRDLSAVNDFN